MTRRLHRAIATMALSTAALGAGLFAAQTTPRSSAPVRPIRSSATAGAADEAFLTTYCVTCHNPRTKAGSLTIDATGLAHVGRDVESWEKVVRKLRTGMMPPAGMPRPARESIDAFATALEARLDAANPEGRHLDTPTFQRLNRVEYANAVRDLLALDVDTKALLPGDDSSHGFDNLAEALTVSPSLVQAYVSAAQKISRSAIGDRTVAPSQVTYSAPSQWAHDKHVEGLPLGTRGGLLVAHMFPLDAEYEFTVGGGGGQGLGGSTLDVTVDGAPLAVENPRTFRQRITAGPHKVGLALVDRQRGAGVDDTFSDHRTGATFVPGGGIQTLTILGPFAPSGTGDTPSRRRLLTCRPTTAADEEPCARRILSATARRAYRRAVNASDVDTLMTFYREGHKEGGFESGLQQALARILVAPSFLFRTEEPKATAVAGSTYAISDVALASRLSFFLWSTIPDDQLLDLAIAGRLSRPGVLRQQVQRMLADPRAHALAENFAGQWLFLRDLDTLQTEAKHFDDNLRVSFRRETEMLFDSLVQEDRSLLTLLDADYTFVDERLARHYGIPGVYGSHFRRVPLPADSPRRGILGHGSVQTVTSVATRTSPVLRGKWVLENLLGAPPPEPPPGVEVNLDAPAGVAPTTTLRQRLEMHRQNPVCASCHKIMDPIGFALENFDLVGAWREADGPGKVDATGQLADGTPVTGPNDLRQAVISRKHAFVTVATEKLLTYAMGREVRATDMASVRAIVGRLEREQYRFSALVTAVVESAPFRMRVKKS